MITCFWNNCKNLSSNSPNLSKILWPEINIKWCSIDFKLRINQDKMQENSITKLSLSNKETNMLSWLTNITEALMKISVDIIFPKFKMEKVSMKPISLKAKILTRLTISISQIKSWADQWLNFLILTACQLPFKRFSMAGIKRTTLFNQLCHGKLNSKT